MKYAIAVLALCLPAFTYAQPYVSAQGGLSFPQDSDNTQSGETFTSSYDVGYNLALRGGYAFNNFRIEGELQYAESDLDQIKYSGVGIDAGGSVAATALTVNGVYVFLPQSSFHPYAGAGIGLAQVDVDNINVSGVRLADDSDTVFAYQVMAGVEFDLSDRAAVYADYHYLATADPTFQDVGGYDFDSEYASHNISIGVRYSF